MIEKLQKITFFLIVFFISSQVGFHFWPEFSKVSGIRIDYLSPTIYLLDILILGLFLFSVPKIPRYFNHIKKTKFSKFIIALFVLSLIWNLFYSMSIPSHLFGIVKLIEFVFLGFYISLEFKKRDISSFVKVLSLSAIISSVLTIWQFILQSSVGGVWYFFGERTFNISTIGISTVTLGKEILRPYAAFPHPNLLAFFLLTSIIFVFLRISYEKKNTKFFLILSILLSCVALILTSSRVIIFLLICLFIYGIYAKQKRNALYFVPIFVTSFVLLWYFIPGVLSSPFLFRGINLRQELLFQSLDIFLKNPYFGIGINNFFIYQSDLVKNISPILFQPPHNIFIIAILSFGIFGWWIFPTLFWSAIRWLTKGSRSINQESRDFRKSILFILISIIIVGMVDHFFVTLEQGQVILALIFGLSFSKLLPEAFKKRKG